MYQYLRARTPSQPLIAINDVSKRFMLHTTHQRSLQESFIRLFQRRQLNTDDYFWALRNVTLTIDAGDCIGIIGPNGSGKSTLLKLITGIIQPDTGSARVQGRMSSLLELGAGFHPDLTGRENIFLNASIYGLSTKEINARLDRIIEFSELEEFIDMPVKHYSSGMYVRLGFAVAIHTDPDILLIDEVLAVGDTHFQNKCIDSVMKFRRQGGTLLLVSHGLETIQSICNRVIWFDKGQVQADGDPVDVVMAYRNRVAEEENAVTESVKTDEISSSQRWGSGEIEITDVELVGQDGEERTTFYTGEKFTIRIQYKANKRIEIPIFGIALHHQNGAHVTGPNTQTAGITIEAVEGKGEIVYTIPSLPLLDGGYLITIAATDHSGSVIYDYHDRFYPFRVYPGNTLEQYGMVTLGGQWQLESEGHISNNNGLVKSENVKAENAKAETNTEVETTTPINEAIAS